jgi:hypothetical protein
MSKRPDVESNGLAVIGAGLARTGTTSFHEAMHVLGFDPCYHDADLFGLDDGPNAGHLDAWFRLATEGVQPDWRRLFANYRAVVNTPGSRFYRELVAAFPDAKVVLTVRDVEGWLRSVRVLYEFFVELGHKGATETEAGRRWQIVMTKLEWDQLGDVEDTDQLRRAFHEHNESVIADVPPDRLLVFDVRDGCDPLCQFLGVSVPAEPFPRANDSEFLKQVSELDGTEFRDALRGPRQT